MEAQAFISYKRFLSQHLYNPILHFTQVFIYFRALNPCVYLSPGIYLSPVILINTVFKLLHLDGAMKLSKSEQRREAGMASIQSNGCSGLLGVDLRSEKSTKIFK